MSSYFKKAYLTDTRLFAYIEQYGYVNENDNVLEIGNGAGVLGDIVKKIGNYTSVDIDNATNPDIVADITRYEQIESLTGRFDIIFCCQVLEHMPLDQSKIAFENLLKLGAKKVVVSIPDNRLGIRLAIKIPKISIRSVLTFPWSGKDVNIGNNNEHYWELYSRNYKEIMNIFQNPQFSYSLTKQYRFYGRHKQHFFVYEKSNLF